VAGAMEKKSAIELLFDAGLERAVSGILVELRDAGLPSPLLTWTVPPHVSLILGGAAVNELERAVAEFAAATPSIPVALDGVGTFGGDNGVVFLGPLVDRALLDLHRAAHEALGPHVPERDPRYLPGRWMPHCTVSVGLDEEQVPAAVALCRRREFPLTGRATRIAIHDVTFDPAKEGWDRVVEMRYRCIRELATSS